ncbi:MAG: hypothetical protein ABSD08_07880 [Xanthobacteraceae bacterium]
MILVGGFFRRRVTLALLGDDVDEERPVLGVAHVFQHRQEMIDVVAVDGPDVEEAELVEQRAAGEQPARIFLDCERALLEHLARQPFGDLANDVAQAAVAAPGDAAGEVSRERADRRRNRHVVVVEHHDETGIHRARIVHGLIGHAGRHGAVADDGDDVVRLAFEIAGDRHAEAGGDRGRGMRGAERIIFALGALGETGQAAALTQRADAVASAGENLVRIGLVTDVPNEPIGRRVEHVVQRHGQLDHAEPGAEMAAGDRNGVDGLLPQLIGKLAQLAFFEPPEVAWRVDKVEQRSLGRNGHANAPSY